MVAAADTDCRPICSATPHLARVERIAAALADGLAVPLEDGLWLRDALRRYRVGAPKGLRLDDVFGVAVAPGKKPWWHRAAVERRDAALRELSAARWEGNSQRARAAEMLTALRRYEATGWRF